MEAKVASIHKHRKTTGQVSLAFASHDASEETLLPAKARGASVLYWICIWRIGWLTQSENSGLVVMIRYVAQDSSSIFFTCGYCIWSFLEYTNCDSQ